MESSAQLRIAVLDPQLSAQLGLGAAQLEGVEVVWSGSSLREFRELVPSLQPHVIALGLDVLAGDPVEGARTLAEETGAEMTLVLYSYAKRQVVRALNDARARPVRAPLSLESLRGLLSGLMVRKILSSAANPPTSEVANVRELAEPRFVGSRKTAASDTRYSMEQLGRLREIDSAVDCECPANLADLLTQLVAFERYSANCSNKNDDDRQIHEMLHDETRRARMVIEDAMVRLLKHEKIEL